MATFREKVGGVLRAVPGLLKNRRESAPIDSVAKFEEFVATRSAYIGQKTLYGYVKTRMGIRYPAMFEDAQIIASLNVAKVHIFAGCLSDLAIYAVGFGLKDQPLNDEGRDALARHCYEMGLRENTAGAPEQFSAQSCIDEFNVRLQGTDWKSGATRPENFTASPRALYRWAPIADQLKRLDSEIIENSIKYAWRDVREQFARRIDAPAVYGDWSARSGAA